MKDIEITMYRQIFYHKNKFKTKEMEKFAEFALAGQLRENTAMDKKNTDFGLECITKIYLKNRENIIFSTSSCEVSKKDLY